LDVLGLLRQYIREDFLILSVILGYLAWVLFFYTSDDNQKARKYWQDYEWGDRLLTGALIGVFLLWFFSFGVATVIGFVCEKVLIQTPDYTQAWAWSAILFSLALCVLRIDCNGPIHGNIGKWWKKRKRPCLHIAEFASYSFVLLFFNGLWSLSYGRVSPSMSSVWAALLGATIIFLLFTVYPFVVFVCLLAGVSLKKVIRLDFKSNSPRIKLPSIHSIRRSLRHVCKSVFVALVSLAFILGDQSFGLIASSLSHVEIETRTDFLVVGSIENYSVLQPTTATYWIRIPRFPIFRNMTIDNPSNYSYTHQREDPILRNGIFTESRNAACEPLLVKGKVIAFNVIPDVASVQPLDLIFVVLRFSNRATDAKVGITILRDNKTRIDASIERRTITIRLTNGENKTASFERILICSVRRPILSIEKYVNGTLVEKPSPSGEEIRLYYFTCSPKVTYVVTHVFEYRIQG